MIPNDDKPKYKGLRGYFERRHDEHEERQHRRQKAKKERIRRDVEEANPPGKPSTPTATIDAATAAPTERPHMDRATAAKIIRSARWEAGGAGNAKTTKQERSQARNMAGAFAAALLATRFDIPQNKSK